MVALTLSKEHVGWLNDILQDYEAMIITANNTITEMRKQREELLTKSDDKEATKDLAEKLETLKRDEWHVKVAELRYREIQDKIWKYLWVTPADVKPDIEWAKAAIDAAWAEQIHPVDEAEKVVDAEPIN